MKKRKRLLSIVCASIMAFSLLAGCSSAPPEDTSAPKPEQTGKPNDIGADNNNTATSNVTLTFMSNLVGAADEVLEGAIKEFTKETGIQVEYSAPGANYEELLKTKMATKDLPDLWTTHGWSVGRYSEYLRPLNDQEFAANVVDAIKPMITDKEGKIYVLPVDVDIAGIVYNVDVLEKSGVNVDDIKTWADFESACEKIKAAGFIPIHIGGKDNWPIGQYFDWVAPSFYVTNESKNYREEFKDGTFDWQLWTEICTMLEKWNSADYINTDSLTSDYITASKSLGEGKIGFEFYGNYVIFEALNSSPDAKLGMMPIPAKDSSDTPTLIAGERLAIGVWNETPHEEEALQLLNYLASPEVCAKLATASSNPAGLKGVTSDTGVIQQYYEKYANVRTFPYFDREYLPTGIWDDLCVTGARILAKENNAVSESVKQMEQSYKDKFSQQ